MEEKGERYKSGEKVPSKRSCVLAVTDHALGSQVLRQGSGAVQEGIRLPADLRCGLQSVRAAARSKASC